MKGVVADYGDQVAGSRPAGHVVSDIPTQVVFLTMGGYSGSLTDFLMVSDPIYSSGRGYIQYT